MRAPISQCSPCLNGELPGKSDRRAGTESTGMIPSLRDEDHLRGLGLIFC